MSKRLKKSVSSVPIDCLGVVVEFIPTLRDLRSLELVCKDFNTAVTNLYSRLFNKKLYDSIDELISTPRSGSGYTCLDDCLRKNSFVSDVQGDVKERILKDYDLEGAKLLSYVEYVDDYSDKLKLDPCLFIRDYRYTQRLLCYYDGEYKLFLYEEAKFDRESMDRWYKCIKHSNFKKFVHMIKGYFFLGVQSIK
jgi:hypothetical protein